MFVEPLTFLFLKSSQVCFCSGRKYKGNKKSKFLSISLELINSHRITCCLQYHPRVPIALPSIPTIPPGYSLNTHGTDHVIRTTDPTNRTFVMVGTNSFQRHDTVVIAVKHQSVVYSITTDFNGGHLVLHRIPNIDASSFISHRGVKGSGKPMKAPVLVRMHVYRRGRRK